MFYKNIVFILSLLIISYSIKDPYQTLGISRKSSNEDIKVAYKKLSMLWHPDKNKNSNANEKMIEINDAYDILSDEKKKRLYDSTGDINENANMNSNNNNNNRYNDPFFSHFYGGSSYFDGEDPNRSASINIISSNYEYVVEKDPNSIWIIQVVGRWCAYCKKIAPEWEEFVKLTKGVIKVGRISNDNDQALVRSLNVRNVPHILLVYKGVVSHFKGNYDYINTDVLLDFAAKQLPISPSALSANNVGNFLNYNGGNSIKIVLISNKKQPGFPFKFATNKYKDSATFGFVSVSGGPALESLAASLSFSTKNIPILILSQGGHNSIHTLEISSSVFREKIVMDAIIDNFINSYPELDADNYYKYCFGKGMTCAIVCSSKPIVYKKLMPSMSNINTGFVDINDQASFCNYFGVSTKDNALIFVKATSQEYYLHLDLNEASIRNVFDLIDSDSLTFVNASKHGGLPFLNEKSTPLLSNISNILFKILSPFVAVFEAIIGGSISLLAIPFLLMIIFIILPVMVRLF